LSVCLSVTFVHCAQTTEDINTISFAKKPARVSPKYCKNLAYIDQPLPAYICPKVVHPRLIDRRRYSMANCDRMVRDSAMVTTESL